MERIPVVIASPLEAELVEQLRAVDDQLDVQFEPDLLPTPRYPSDHHGEAGFERTADQEDRFTALVASAEVLFGIPAESPEQLAWAVRTAPGLRFVQATAAGAGQQVHRAALTADELERVAISSASGVHAVPLAEWSIFGLLAFAKGLPRLRRDAVQRHWDHYPTAELRGQTLLVVGVGAIGLEVARLASAFGMRVVGVKRNATAQLPHVDSVHPPEELGELVGAADAIVITLPLTEETRGLIDRETIGRMRDGAILVNVGRGAVIDEEALIEALRSGKLAGAALDVFAEEPLPSESPLWSMENVIVSPHTAALSWHENERIVELFAENLRRYLRGDELLSRVRTSSFY
ncbi:MAG TPA: D-2-hydroxyacid dehydrogenase [Gaiellaceae bacterium]